LPPVSARAQWWPERPDELREFPIVLGGTGYVAGELLRLILGHPILQLVAAMSDSQPGEPVGKAFPHLAAVLNTTFKSQAEVEALLRTEKAPAILAAAPHGVGRIDRQVAEHRRGRRQRAARGRYLGRLPACQRGGYEAIYQHPHGAPARLAQFTCAVPEH
jgi:hypothetical protein